MLLLVTKEMSPNSLFNNLNIYIRAFPIKYEKYDVRAFIYILLRVSFYIDEINLINIYIYIYKIIIIIIIITVLSPRLVYVS